MNTLIHVLQLTLALSESYETHRSFFSHDGAYTRTKKEFVEEVIKQKIGFFLLPDFLEEIMGKDVSHFLVSKEDENRRHQILPEKYYKSWFKIPTVKALKSYRREKDLKAKMESNDSNNTSQKQIDIKVVNEKNPKSEIKNEIIFHLLLESKFDNCLHSKFDFSKIKENLIEFEAKEGYVLAFNQESYEECCLNPIESYCINLLINKIKKEGIIIDEEWLKNILKSGLERAYSPWLVDILMERIVMPNKKSEFAIDEVKEIAKEVYKSISLEDAEKNLLNDIVFGWYFYDVD